MRLLPHHPQPSHIRPGITTITTSPPPTSYPPPTPTFSTLPSSLSTTKSTLQETIILPLKFPQLYSQSRKSTTELLILIHGSPGSGKSYLVEALGNEIGDGKKTVSVNCWEVVCERWIGIADRLVSFLSFSLCSD